MGRYRITAGQNIYDVALHIYGSIEGVTDLLMSNPSLSFAKRLKAGDILYYSDGLIINPEAVAHYKNQGIVPSGGERAVYPKVNSLPHLLDIFVAKDKTAVEISFSGEGTIEVDWSDNSPIEELSISNKKKTVNHTFDNAIGTRRKISIYSIHPVFSSLDFTGVRANSIYLSAPLYTENLTLTSGAMDLTWLALIDGVYDINLKDISTNSLLPLLKCKDMMRLDISGPNLKPHVINNYLIGLVREYYGRHSCTVVMTVEPSGEYKEPIRDEDLNYIINTGMEAIWLITHEPAWNEGGYWKFIIGDKIYTTEP